ncbi:MAG: hypothetical protein NUV76_00880, partial [Candidatus Kuenenia sp.]|nr:hypothetical protein [Candidatus Kuenenia sp.]
RCCFFHFQAVKTGLKPVFTLLLNPINCFLQKIGNAPILLSEEIDVCRHSSATGIMMHALYIELIV